MQIHNQTTVFLLYALSSEKKKDLYLITSEFGQGLLHGNSYLAEVNPWEMSSNECLGPLYSITNSRSKNYFAKKVHQKSRKHIYSY